MAKQKRHKILRIPFIGSKWDRVNDVKDIAEAGGYTRVIEPFGGSGVLSVNLALEGLEAVINDYDHYFDDFEELCDLQDKMLDDIETMGFEVGIKIKQPQHVIDWLQNYVANMTPKQRRFLAQNYMFSVETARYDGTEVKGFKYIKYNKRSDSRREYFKVIKGNNVKLDNLDYLDFFEKYAHEEPGHKTLMLLDPPYLNSTQSSYKNEAFFGLAETIGLLDLAFGSGLDFILFNQIAKDTEALIGLYKPDILDIKTRKRTTHSGTLREDVLALVQHTKNQKVTNTTP